jgi:preprotein translocase subunit SecG
MTIVIYIVTAFFVICSLLLTFVVLLQRPRSEGLGSAFGGGVTESIFGAQTSEVLVKATIWLGSLFFACTLLLAVLYAYRSKDNRGPGLEQKLEQAAKAEAPAASDAPAVPAQEPAPEPAPAPAKP